MKRNLLALIILSSTVFITSCGDDDETPPPHIVGLWELDSFILEDFPSDYASNEGRIVLINEITFGGLTFEEYDIEVLNNGTFEREIKVPGPDLKDDGEWELDDDDFILIPTDGDEIEFELRKNEDDQLWLGEDAQFRFIKDAIRDTLTQEYVDSITQEEFNQLFDNVPLTLVFAFEKNDK